MTEPLWVVEARKYLGVKEIPGPRHNALILKLWSLIKAPFTDDETPWCAAFVGGCLEAVGTRSTRSARSLSYETYGIPLAGPCVGAIAVKKRVGGGHVTFVVGRTRSGALLCLGGNQNDAVRISPYNAADFHAFRWPADTPRPIDYALPTLAWAGLNENPTEA